MTRSRRHRLDRAVSTTLDVTMCLLLVSAAVGVLAAAGPPPGDADPSQAEYAVERLTTTTVAVDHQLSGGSPRTVHGTPAALLARTALANLAAVDGGDASDPPASGFERAVANRTGRVLADLAGRVNVTATYAPCRGSGVRGHTAVGPTPPETADVTVVRVRVPVGGTPSTDALGRAANASGYRGVADALAAATVRTALPPSRTRWALRDESTAGAVAARYAGLADGLDAPVGAGVADGDVERANRRLADAIAGRCERALRERFEEAAAATGGRTAGGPRTVTIAVRTWSP